MKSSFTKTERIICGLYFASIVVGVWRLPFPDPNFLFGFAIGGFLGGYFVASAVIVPEKFMVFLSFAAGCLATFAAALFSALFIAFFESINLDLIYSSGTLGSGKEFWPSFGFLSLFGLIFAIPFCLIGGPAAMFFSYLLSGYRNQNPKIALETFD